MQRIFGKYIECKLVLGMLSLVHLFGDWQPHFWSEICKIEKPEVIQSEVRYLLNLLPTLKPYSRTELIFLCLSSAATSSTLS